MPLFSKQKRHIISISHGRLPKLPKIQAKGPESIDVHSELEAEHLVVIDESNENNAFSNVAHDEFAVVSEREEVIQSFFFLILKINSDD